MIEKIPYVETGIGSKDKGFSWEHLKTEGHNFPDRCPQWSGAGVTQMRMNIISNQEITVVIVVCSCGVVKPVPLG